MELPEDHCKFVPPLPDQDLPPPPPLESPESPPPIVESPESPDPDPSQSDPVLLTSVSSKENYTISIEKMYTGCRLAITFEGLESC